MTKNKMRKNVCNKTIKFEDYKECLENNEMLLTSEQRFKSEALNIFTENNNKIALTANDDKGLQTNNGIKSYPYVTGTRRVCKTKLIK